MSKPQCVVFGDGACLGNPGRGGWGVIIATEKMVVELGGAEAKTTNNRMELMALSRALQRLLESNLNGAKIFLDSKYVIQGATQSLERWRRNGWKKQEGEPIAHPDLWQEVSEQLEQLEDVEFQYVPGHQNVPANERVDHIASAFAHGKAVQLYKGSISEYKKIYRFDPLELPSLEQMQKKKTPAYYLSLIDGVPERHSTWPECEKRVKGRAGAKFKKVFHEKDEPEILKSWGYSGKSK